MKCLRVVCGAAVCSLGAISGFGGRTAFSSGMEAAGEEKPASEEAPAGWVRGKLNDSQSVWGRRGGLVFGIHPGGISKGGEPPRGLLRLYYPVLAGGKYDLVNLIAIQPVVKGRMGFSELEPSHLDAVPGKRLWTSAEHSPAAPPEPGKLTRPAAGVERLEVVLRVEKFDNGAHVYLEVTQRSDKPDEIQLVIRREPDSAAMEYCILSATAGSHARTRLLWLSGEVISSQRLYPDYREFDFAPYHIFPLQRLLRTAEGDVLVAVTSDEQNPAAVVPFPGTRHFYYAGARVTQYWRKPQGTFGKDLSAAVNARYAYWQSQRPLPGGIAFENFELREPFADGQCFVFGITPRTPAELWPAQQRLEKPADQPR